MGSPRKIYLLLFGLGLFTCFLPFDSRAQLTPIKLHDLQGMVDAEGNTHLFYRFKKLEIHSEEFPQEDENHIYHINTETRTDTLFLRDQREAVLAGPDLYGQNTRRVVDFVFPDNDPSSYVLSGHFCVTDCSGYVVTSDSGDITGWMGSGGELTLAPDRDTLYAYQNGFPQGTRIFRYSEDSWITEETDSLNLKYRLLSVHPYLDSLAFGTHRGQLIRINNKYEYQVVMDSLKWWEHSPEFHYGSDTSVVYLEMESSKDNSIWKSGSLRLYRSTKFGKERSWNLVAADSTFFAFETNPRQGRVFRSDGNKLLVSNDQGDTFKEVATFENRITSIYKPDKSTSALYVSTNSDIWYLQGSVKVESFKHVQVDIQIPAVSVPSKYTLKENYPNPFIPTTIIEYSLPEASDVNLTVYNMVGREVTGLVNKRQQSGQHRVTFDASHLSSGVYVYRLETKNFVQSRKMLLIK
jgi:hypothetical protein